MRKEIENQSLELLCGAMGFSRQAHYKWLYFHKYRQQQSEIILHEVKKIRHFHPRMGGRKMHFLITKKAGELGFKVGRDRFFNLLSFHNLLVVPDKRQTITTLCGASIRDYKNRIADQEFTAPNQAWALDITYLRIEKEFRYPALTKDLFSHKIIGHNLSDTLAADGAIKALKMALKQANNTRGLIHHSDNGIQYECKEYRKLLKKYHMQISRAAKGSPWENGSMERTFGCLKDEYGFNRIFKNEPILKKALKETLYLYNHKRPHWSINLMTPEQKHRTCKIV